MSGRMKRLKAWMALTMLAVLVPSELSLGYYEWS